MPATLREVRDIIRREFPNADLDELTEEGQRVTGAIRWNGFRNMPAQERNELVTRRVRNELGLRGLNVGIILPLAPGEAF